LDDVGEDANWMSNNRISVWTPGVRQARWWLLIGVCAVLWACQTPPGPGQAPAPVEPKPFADWVERPMPGKQWRPFMPVEVDGATGLEVRSEASLSLMRKRLPGPEHRPMSVRFSWWVDSLVEGADLSDSGASDAPAQLAVAFDGDRSTLPTRHLMLSELVALITGEPLPHASLVYAWAADGQHPVGTVIKDPRSDRIRYLIVEQGPVHLRRWVHHVRDVQADFRQVFGEEPGPIIDLAIMSDSDNTRGHARAVFGPVTLVPR
jgi:hypothetical protein